METDHLSLWEIVQISRKVATAEGRIDILESADDTEELLHRLEHYKTVPAASR